MKDNCYIFILNKTHYCERDITDSNNTESEPSQSSFRSLNYTKSVEMEWSLATEKSSRKLFIFK